MHELSIVFSIIDEVEKTARDNDIDCVNSVVLEVGEYSSIVAQCLVDIWTWVVKDREILADSTLVIERVEGQALNIKQIEV